MASRRGFLKTVGKGGLVIGGVVGVSGLAAGNHVLDAPSHVSREFNQSVLENYRPRLVIQHLDRKPIALYGFKATSTEHNHTALVYFARYTASGSTIYEGHPGDHEPFYLFIDESKEEILEVVYTGYHWLAARTTSPTVDVSDGENHPLFKVDKPYHHYYETSTEGSLVEVRHLSDSEYQNWLDNGLESDIQPGVVMNPWTMASVDGGDGRSHWWDGSFGGFSISKTLWQIQLRLGIRGADTSDI